MKFCEIAAFVSALFAVVINGTHVYITWDEKEYSNVTGVTIYQNDAPSVEAKIRQASARTGASAEGTVPDLEAILSVRIEYGQDESTTIPYSKAMYSHTPCQRHVINVSDKRFHATPPKKRDNGNRSGQRYTAY